MMRKSRGETPKDSLSQSAKPGAAQPRESVNPDPSEATAAPPFSKETFLAIKVQKGASLEDIVDAVEDALRTVEDPFFQLATPPQSGQEAADQETGFIPCGKALAMYVRYEGP
jgi:hypothetical protein